MSTKLRPSVFGVILLVLSLAVLATIIWQTFRVNKLQTEIEKLQVIMELRTPPHRVGSK